MSELNSIVDQVLRDPYASARDLARTGRRIIGYVGDHVPVELILAADAVPLRLFGRTGSTPRANLLLEKSFSPALRSIAEHWLSGSLDFLHSVIFPRNDDSAQRLYYYLCELQRTGRCRGPRPLIFDIASIDRASSREHTVAATLGLAAELGSDEPRLETAAAYVTRRRKQLDALQSLDLNARSSQVQRVVRAAQQAWTATFGAALEHANTEIERLPSAHRILLAGSSPPDARLHRAVEDGGGNVVCDLTTGSSASCDGVATFEELAHRYYLRARRVQRTSSESPWLDAARARNVQGAIFWLIEEDEGIVWALPQQVRELEQANIPVLTLTRQSWDAEDAVLARIAQFIQSLRTTA